LRIFLKGLYTHFLLDTGLQHSQCDTIGRPFACQFVCPPNCPEQSQTIQNGAISGQNSGQAK
jgi:hypothetical protein